MKCCKIAHSIEKFLDLFYFIYGLPLVGQI